MTVGIRQARLFVGAIASVMLLGSSLAGATPSASVTRLAGTDRVATAIAISQQAWGAEAAGAVVLARSDAFPDALAGGPLAVARQGPLLLTPPAGLDARVAAEIDRVLAAGRSVHFLGGTAALSKHVAGQVEARGYQVVRYGGADRFETAVLIAREGLGAAVSSVLVADGMAFPDALIAGAAAPKVDGALLLSAGSVMPASTHAYLARDAASLPRYAIGNAAATATNGATRIAGADAYETSTLVATQLVPGAISVAVASGVKFPDGLAGGAHIGALSGPLLLTEPDRVPPSVDRYLRTNADTIARAFVYGGTAAITDQAADHIRNAVRDTFQSLSSTAQTVLRESAQNFDGGLVRWTKSSITVAVEGNWTPGALEDAVAFWNELLKDLGVTLQATTGPADMVFTEQPEPNPGAPSYACGQEGPTAYDGHVITAAGGAIWPTYGQCGEGRAGNEASWDRTVMMHSIGHSLGLLSHTPSKSDVMGSPESNSHTPSSAVLVEVYHYLYSAQPGTQVPPD